MGPNSTLANIPVVSLNGLYTVTDSWLGQRMGKLPRRILTEYQLCRLTSPPVLFFSVKKRLWPGSDLLRRNDTISPMKSRISARDNSHQAKCASMSGRLGPA